MDRPGLTRLGRSYYEINIFNKESMPDLERKPKVGLYNHTVLTVVIFDWLVLSRASSLATDVEATDAVKRRIQLVLARWCRYITAP